MQTKIVPMLLNERTDANLKGLLKRKKKTNECIGIAEVTRDFWQPLKDKN